MTRDRLPLALHNGSGEHLSIDTTRDGGLLIGAHDGTEGGTYQADPQDVADAITALVTWFQSLPVETQQAIKKAMPR